METEVGGSGGRYENDEILKPERLVCVHRILDNFCCLRYWRRYTADNPNRRSLQVDKVFHVQHIQVDINLQV